MDKKIIARFIIEIAGKPVENVDKALKLVLNKLKEEKDKFKVVDSFIENPTLDEKTTLFAGFIEVSVQFKNVSRVLDFIIDYTPTSIEIEEPEKITFDSNEFNGVLNDISQMMLGSNAKIRHLEGHIHMQNLKLKELENKK